MTRLPVLGANFVSTIAPAGYRALRPTPIVVEPWNMGGKMYAESKSNLISIVAQYQRLIS